MTVAELLAAFITHAEAYYVDAEGAPTTSVTGDIQRVARVMRGLYGTLPVARFGPLELRACRAALVHRGLSRGVCNSATSAMRRIVKWGVAEGMVEPSILVGLQAVEPLKRGRTEAPDHEPVRPVPEAHVWAIEPHVSRQVMALAKLGLWTGARMGELVTMRPMDLDTSGPVWLYRPAQHKGAWRGHERTICLGPRAQEVVAGFLAGRPTDAPLFQPREAEAERRQRQHAERRTPIGQGNRPGSNVKRRPKRKPGERYTTGGVCLAIGRGCEKAGIEPAWTPHQLRHTHATTVRRRYGLEAAGAALGHKGLSVTEVYAERDSQLALKVAREVG